jgi:hypothetical protein
MKGVPVPGCDRPLVSYQHLTIGGIGATPSVYFCFCIRIFVHRGHIHFRCLWNMCPLTSFIATLHFRHVTLSQNRTKRRGQTPAALGRSMIHRSLNSGSSVTQIPISASWQDSTGLDRVAPYQFSVGIRSAWSMTKYSIWLFDGISSNPNHPSMLRRHNACGLKILSESR